MNRWTKILIIAGIAAAAIIMLDSDGRTQPLSPDERYIKRCVKDSFGNYTCTDGSRILYDSFGNIIVVPGGKDGGRQVGQPSGRSR